MSSMTIRNLDDRLKIKLRVRAAENGRSMEEEVRDILRDALAEKPSRDVNLYESIRAKFAPLGGVELDIPARTPMREPPRFDE